MLPLIPTSPIPRAAPRSCPIRQRPPADEESIYGATVLLESGCRRLPIRASAQPPPWAAWLATFVQATFRTYWTHRRSLATYQPRICQFRATTAAVGRDCLFEHHAHVAPHPI